MSGKLLFHERCVVCDKLLFEELHNVYGKLLFHERCVVCDKLLFHERSVVMSSPIVTVPCLSREPNRNNLPDHLPSFKTLLEYSKCMIFSVHTLQTTTN